MTGRTNWRVLALAVAAAVMVGGLTGLLVTVL